MLSIVQASAFRVNRPRKYKHPFSPFTTTQLWKKVYVSICLFKVAPGGQPCYNAHGTKPKDTGERIECIPVQA